MRYLDSFRSVHREHLRRLIPKTARLDRSSLQCCRCRRGSSQCHRTRSSCGRWPGRTRPRPSHRLSRRPEFRRSPPLRPPSRPPAVPARQARRPAPATRPRGRTRRPALPRRSSSWGGGELAPEDGHCDLLPGTIPIVVNRLQHVDLLAFLHV